MCVVRLGVDESFPPLVLLLINLINYYIYINLYHYIIFIPSMTRMYIIMFYCFCIIFCYYIADSSIGMLCSTRYVARRAQRACLNPPVSKPLFSNLASSAGSRLVYIRESWRLYASSNSALLRTTPAVGRRPCLRRRVVTCTTQTNQRMAH